MTEPLHTGVARHAGPQPARGLDATRAWVQRLVDSGRLHDAVLGVADSTGVVALDAFGPTAPSARYALFSVSKPLVALLVARAVERGALSLRAPLAPSLPGFDRLHREPVRLHHLLTHTAGLAEPALDDARPIRQLLIDAEQLRAPGTSMQYSSLAFEGVSAILQHHTGEGVDEQLARLNDFTSDRSLSFDPEGAQPVHGLREAGFDYLALVAQRHPGAGLFGSATSLLELGSDLLRSLRGESTLIRATTLQSMIRARTLGLVEPEPEPERREFGLGWHPRAGAAGLLDDRWFGHAGWSGAQWWINPPLDRVVVLLTGLADFPSAGIDADELLNTVGPSV